MKFSATLVSLSLVAVTIAHQLPSQFAAARRGNQVVFGACSADADCQQGCCGFSSGKCAGPAVAQTNGSGGCGHGTGTPNCNVATLLGFPGTCIAGHVNTNLQDPAVQAAAAFAAQLDGIAFTPSAAAAPPPAAPAPANNAAASGASQSSKLTVFEQCSADSDCQQGCCGFTSGKCAGPAVAQTNGSGGCGHGTGLRTATSRRCSASPELALRATSTPTSRTRLFRPLQHSPRSLTASRSPPPSKRRILRLL